MKPEKFAENLGDILDTLGLSQVELAARAGLTQAALSQILSGKREPSLRTICKILSVVPVAFERLVK